MSTRRLFCNECDKRTQAEPDHTDGRPNDTYSCTECGEAILCDECGAEWSDEHECAEADQ